MKIALVSTTDRGGSAEKIAHGLWRAFREAEQEAWLVVGRKVGDEADVLELPNDEHRGRFSRAMYRLERSARFPALARAAHVAGRAAEPMRAQRSLRGYEDMDHPGTEALLDVVPQVPDVINLHNLHGGYFDLRWLPAISRALPTVLTLHDAWLMSGHCAHAMDCERWREGCGHCPDLRRYPSVRRDATAENWELKRSIYRRSRLHVAAPCEWLLSRAQQSILADGIVETRRIVHGVDLGVFQPRDRTSVRARLGVPEDAFVVVYDAKATRGYRDPETANLVLRLLAQRHAKAPMVFLALGEDGETRWHNRARWQFTGFISDERLLADHLGCADVYLHCTRADTFPNLIMEAMACGVPAVASAIGGIPEQLNDRSDGLLVPAAEPGAAVDALESLVADRQLAPQMGRAAAQRARELFDARATAEAYLAWFADICDEEL